MNDPSQDSGKPAGDGLRWLRGPFLGACFFFAAGVADFLLDARLPFPPVPEIAARFRYFAERKDDFNTIFIGSSRVRHQVIPRQFDAEVAASGVAIHSINLGYSGMWPPESFYFLRQVLALQPRHLRWVIIELMDYRFGEAEHRPPTMRMVYWHDWKHTGMAFSVVAESSLSLIEKGRQLARHAWLFLQRTTNPGRGADWLHDRYFPMKKKPDTSWIKRAGFDPEEKGEWSDGARADFAQKVQALERSLAPRSLRPGLDSALRELITEVRRAGAQPIFILPPSIRTTENLAGALPPDTIVWAFNNPVEYPRLFLPELHYDPGHLNEDGAREFTSLLAQRLADLARKR